MAYHMLKCDFQAKSIWIVVTTAGLTAVKISWSFGEIDTTQDHVIKKK